MTDFAALLDCYSLEELLELNDLTMEECLAFLVEEKYLILPEVTPIDFDD